MANTTIAVVEVGVGLARMPESRRPLRLEAKFQPFVGPGLGPCVFRFDTATVYGGTVAARERAGRPLDGFAVLLAAMAQSRDAMIAPCNRCEFAGGRASIVNP